MKNSLTHHQTVMQISKFLPGVTVIYFSAWKQKNEYSFKVFLKLNLLCKLKLIPFGGNQCEFTEYLLSFKKESELVMGQQKEILLFY